jgi:mannosyl-oligosaccharide alpha-1,2-mannosidase
MALAIFACAFIALWNTYGFWVLPPRFLSRSRTYTLDNGLRYMTSSYDWSKARVFYPVSDIQTLPTAPPKTFPEIQAKTASSKDGDDKTASERKQIIKGKFIKSWTAYKKNAWGRDELTPISGRGKKSLSGWGAQIVDALDTLWIMGLKDEFREAVDVAITIDWSRTSDWSINVFEVTIRYLGGLLAAHDLSREPALLAKAVELGDTLYAVFDTPNRLPRHWLNYGKAARGRQLADERMSGAAGGTLCLEFTRLSQLTGDPKYYDATERVKQFLHRWQPETKIPGLWPIMISLSRSRVCQRSQRSVRRHWSPQPCP